METATLKMNNTLTKIQSQLKAPKNQFNSFGKYNYRSAEDILEGLKPLLAEHGAYVVLTDEVVNVGERFYVKAMCKLVAPDITEVAVGMAREEETKKGMDGSQVTGAASSYARKYAMNGLFAIDDTKDSDGTNDGKPDAKPASKPAAKPAKPADSPEVAEKKAALRTLIEAYKKTEIAKTKPVPAVTHDTLKKNNLKDMAALQTCTNPIVFAELIDDINAAMESAK